MALYNVVNNLILHISERWSHTLVSGKMHKITQVGLTKFRTISSWINETNCLTLLKILQFEKKTKEP